MIEPLLTAIRELEAGGIPDIPVLAALLASEAGPVCEALLTAADRCNRQHHGDWVEIRAILEISNYCRCDCAYCGLCAGNRTLTRYRLTPAEILTAVAEVVAAGYATVILQSGEDLYYSREIVGELVRTIKAQHEIAVTLSLGERPYEEYAYWRDCGADRYLIKHETASPQLYAAYHPGHTLEQRLRCQTWLRELGYELGGGFMVGLPGQTREILAQDVLLLRQMEVAMAGIGPYIAHPRTQLAGSADGSAALTLRVLALARLLTPAAHLPSTTALNVKGGLADALNCGANVIMQKATPAGVRDLYDIYPGRESQYCSLTQQRQDLIAQLARSGRRGR